MKEFFKKSYYINRKSRVDRKDAFEKQLKKNGLIDWVERYEAVDKDDVIESVTPSKGEIACGTSHKTIIEIAKKNNFENVLIFEDDATFLDNFQDVINNAIQQIKNIDWDLFYLSCRLFDSEIDFLSENLIKINSCYCTHAYCVNRKAYDKYLEYNPHKQPVDVFLLNQDFKRIGSYPLCVSTSASNSDIVNGYTNYDSLFVDSYKKPAKN
jgi:GR25 family glycosyltransferase involved in LPS biosynthesis